MTMPAAASDKAEVQRASPRPSSLAPFRHRAFALLWVATVVSNVGTWMHDVGAGWLMTELAASPVMVAAVQAAATLPIFLFALLAGAIADIADKRKLLIRVNVAMGLAAALMAALVQLELMTPALLLAFTFVFGTGTAFMAPAWQAIVPRLVSRAELPAAIALNSMGINVSRAIGPALAGVLIVAAGLASPFLVNALSVIGIIAALWWWRPTQEPANPLPPEQIGGALRAGLRFALNSAPLQATLLRASVFFVFASAFWAMLPLIAREVLSGGPTLYGVLLASVGAGAVAGALVLPRIKTRLGPDRTVAAGTLGTAITLVLMATSEVQAIATAAAALAGLSWIAVLSSLNVSAQMALPDWVRARGLSIFLTVFFGTLSAGSLLWGQVAALWGLPTALLLAALGAVLCIPLTWRARLGQGEGLDHTPSMHWPEPILTAEAGSNGPVMIQIEYRVRESERAAFLSLMAELARSRRRGGGYRWAVMQDAAATERFVETWWEASWLDHQRHHQRVTEEDRKLQARIAATLTPGFKPIVSHCVMPDTGGG